MRWPRGPRGGERHQLIRWILLIILLAAAALLSRNRLPWQADDSPTGGMIRGVARVVDGDSLTIGRARIRLNGIDAPEGPQTCRRDGREWPCGEDSRRRLADLIGGDALSCRIRDRDKHGRALAICSTKAHVVNAAMVTSGYAVSFGAAYAREEAEARAARRGLWSGEFQRPQEWRRERGIGG